MNENSTTFAPTSLPHWASRILATWLMTPGRRWDFTLCSRHLWCLLSFLLRPPLISPAQVHHFVQDQTDLMLAAADLQGELGLFLLSVSRPSLMLYVLWSECLCLHPRKCICWNLTLKVMVLGGGAWLGQGGRWLGPEGGAVLRNGSSALMKEAGERSLAPSASRGHSEKRPIYESGGGHHDPALPSPQTVSDACPLLISPSVCWRAGEMSWYPEKL